jgi:nucleoside-triphosphatase THEP1
LVLLISASYKWKENGLFWRAGVICALLKTMSPSAVIFGPMIAIFSESVLLEISVRLLGRSVPGFILGSVLAMSWNLFQKIFNYIIFYGYNIVEVYTNLMKYAEKQLNLKFDAVWMPVLLLLVIYALFGAFSALVGIRTGKRITKDPKVVQNFVNPVVSDFQQLKKHNKFNHSVYWLVLNITLIACSLFLIDRIPFGVWVAMCVIIAVIWAIRYKRALRQVSRPRLWIFFVIITMITAFVFTRLQSDKTSVYEAILIGVEMNMRAIILIMGFTVLGTELYNPKIRNFFTNSYFKQLPLALELSVESLPAVIANTPDVKTMLRNPGAVVHHLINYAEARLSEIRPKPESNQKVYVVTGKIESGKTTLISELVTKLQTDKISVSGIYSKRIVENYMTTGYNVVKISNYESVKFLRTKGSRDQQRIGKFYIYDEGLLAGKEELLLNKTQIKVIDEIGKLELEGKGWCESLYQIIEDSDSNLLLSVREEVLNEVIVKFGFSNEMIYSVNENRNDDLYLRILKDLQKA